MAKKHGKKYLEVKKLIDKTKKYSIQEAVSLLKQSSTTKFVATVEMHVRTTADAKYNDQMIRGTVVLPHGTGKTVIVAAFVSDDKIDEAKSAGADIAGSENLLKDILAGKMDFDVLITTNEMMRDLAKVAKVLGPKGMMPSPKAGTVTANIKQTIDEIKKGRVEYKLDKTGNLHIVAGKISFTEAQLVDNIKAVLASIEENKPSGIKAQLFKKVVVCTTMGPGIQLEA